jgi:ditrans,polycis-polyprenyl diphosphate synthase
MAFHRLVSVCCSPLRLHSQRATLNICIPYASKDEMAYSINRCIQNKVSVKRTKHQNGTAMSKALGVDGDDPFTGAACQESSLDAITIADIESNLMLSHSPPLDILVRTSGVCRLSDFMLWQVSSNLRGWEGSYNVRPPATTV